MSIARRQRILPLLLLTGAGCGPLATSLRPAARPVVNRLEVKHRALDYLQAALGNEDNPAVRVEAVEALESCGAGTALPRIRTALTDSEPAVRFAACAALGRHRDRLAQDTLQQLTRDSDHSVAVAALFALHRIGQTDQTGRIPDYLLLDKEPAVRRNAALLLGLMDEAGAVRVLARAMRDRDAGVRMHALEAMARLGNREAIRELTFMTNAGTGSEEVFAIAALTETGDPVFLDTFRYKLATATHIEVRLAAARGLGRLGADDGYDVALRTLVSPKPTHRDAGDPPAGQRLRAQQMAAAALAAIGRMDALPALIKVMDRASDPRIRVSAARAVLELLATARQH
ncbi:MAG: HEAT repeat domain-containing protein, partial [Phycisphaerae bacterium]